MPTSLPLRAAITLGITSSAMLSSGNLTLWLVSIPSLLATTSTPSAPSASLSTAALLSQWQLHYNSAKSFALPLVAASGLSFGYAAFRASRSVGRPSRSSTTTLLLSAVAMAVAVPVFTVTCMAGPIGNVNGALGELNQQVNVLGTKDVSVVSRAEVIEMLNHWAVLCAVRGLFPLVGAVMGAWAGL